MQAVGGRWLRCRARRQVKISTKDDCLRVEDGAKPLRAEQCLHLFKPFLRTEAKVGSDDVDRRIPKKIRLHNAPRGYSQMLNDRIGRSATLTVLIGQRLSTA